MNIFTLRIEVSESDSTADVAEKLERIARSIREQSDSATFLEDASVGGGLLTQPDVRGTWSIEP
jgi:hypothetical protein